MPDDAEIAKIMEAIRGLHFVTDSDTELRAHLDRLLRRDDEGNLIPEPVRFGRTNETRGILFVQAAGAGKTTTVARALEKHPALLRNDLEFPPYLAASVPTEPTLKSMALKLLEAAGYRLDRTRRTTYQLFDHLRELMVRNGQTILWLDEAQDLMARDQQQILRATKSLMQAEGSVIVIMSGTEELEDVIRSDPQVQRRFTIVKPDPLVQSLDDDRLNSIMEEFCRRASLRPLSDPTFVPRILIASRHLFGRAIEMMENAVEQALQARETELDLWHFGLAWGMQETRDAAMNPFTVDDWERIDPDAPPFKDPKKPRNRH